MLDKGLLRVAKRIKLIVFDFDGVFTDNRVIVFDDGREAVMCDRADGIGLESLRKLGIEPLILSTEPNSVVRHRAKKLNVNCINNCRDKLNVLMKEIKKRKISPDRVAYVGNDINDLECLKIVGLPVAVANSHKEILGCAKFRTKLRGGRGAVREICDFLSLCFKDRGKPDA